MKLLQLIYTSCKKGLSGGSGFQTYAMSEGIDEEERREIERYGLYVPPTHLPTQPGREEIEKLFPTALRFFRLQSGRYGICQSRYIGRDYSGRYGNYFSHALILDSGYFPVYPIRLYNSPVFRDHLTEEEIQGHSPPGPLPALDREKITSPLRISFDEVSEFIKDTGIEPVKKMVTAAVDYHETHRSLVLSGSPTNIAYWIAAIQMAFPLKMAHNLTFTTYTHDPTSMNLMISAVPQKGSRFAFSETQRNFEHYIFDFENQGIAGLDREYEFTKNIDIGYTISPDSLAEFHDFINLFDFNFINKELDSLCFLLTLTRVGVEDLSPKQVLAAVRFADKYATVEILQQLAGNFSQILDSLSSSVDFESAETLSTFLFKIARQSPGKKHLETAYRFFFQSLDHHTLSPPQPDRESIENFFHAVREQNKNHGEEFAAAVLSQNRLRQIIKYITNNRSPQCTEIYFNVVIGTVISFRYSWDDMEAKQPLFKSFIEYSLANLLPEEIHLKRAMQSAGKDNDFFVDFISFCLTHLLTSEEKRAIFLNNYIKVVENKTTASAVHVRLGLIQRGHSQFIYEEYFNLLHDAPDKPVFFRTYFDSVFKKDRTFLQEYFSPAVDGYLELLWEKEKFKECEKLIDAAELITDPEVVRRVIRDFEKGTVLLSPGRAARKKMVSVQEIKKKRKIITSPDITGLILLGTECEKAGLEPEAVKISQLIKPGAGIHNLEDLDIQRFKDYLSWCLPNLLSLMKSHRDHQLIFQWLGTSKLGNGFVPAYIAGIKRLLKEDKESGLRVFLDFFKFYLIILLEDKQYFAVLEESRGDLIKMLCKLSKSQFDHIRSKVLKSSAVEKPAGKREFVKMLEEVSEKKQSSLFNQFTRLFQKKNSAPKVNSKKIKRIKKNRR
ncbi:MAG: hypothetical protein KAW12_05565 [Candidatus Aminicenantes bacterium]|nr:hypothetical protein [Candidatus Aminicenantes bacterium]